MFTHAITRKPGENFAQGITACNSGKPDYSRILKQHNAYITALKSLGLQIIMLDPQPDYPDAYFVEDTAVAIPEAGVITNPGAPSRKGEEDSIEPVLSKYRKIFRIHDPGTVDGGDVLMAGRHFFIGISDRTNSDGAEQLGTVLEGYGYTWDPIQVRAGLHLKSSVNFIGKNTLLITKPFAGFNEFRGYEKIIAEEPEQYAANTLLINECLIMPTGYPATKKKLEAVGYDMIELDMSEVRKMDGGLTCMSVRF